MNITFTLLTFLFICSPELPSRSCRKSLPAAGNLPHPSLPCCHTRFSSCTAQHCSPIPHPDERCSHVAGQTHPRIPQPTPHTLGVMSWVMQNSRCCRMLSMVW